MYICDLALNDYRSYNEAVVSFDKGITALVGSNGQGKTNLVESIGYLSTFSSHRVKNDATLIRYDTVAKLATSAAVIRAKVISEVRTNILELEVIQGKPNRARLNKNNVKNRELLGYVKTVIFAPEDLQLIKGDPSKRRQFIDDLIVQIYPAYMGVRLEIEKVLRQRNAVLKSLLISLKKGIKPDYSILQIWNEQLAKLCAKTLRYRTEVLELLRHKLTDTYGQVARENKELTFEYQSNLEQYTNDFSKLTAEQKQDELLVEKLYLQAFELSGQKEIERGVNLVGTHRDDIEFFLNDIPVKGYASHGETWSVALALRIASFQVLKDIFEEDPILILDDVFAELDSSRRESLVSLIKNVEQVFITVAVRQDMPDNLDAKVFIVENKNGISTISAE